VNSVPPQSIQEPFGGILDPHPLDSVEYQISHGVSPGVW
jgi:hypothetical protein